MKAPWIFWLGLGVLLAACQPYQFKGSEYPKGFQAEDFTLTTSEGQLFRLRDQRGNIVLMFFGYTTCPDVCPTALAEAGRILEGLGSELENVRFVFITVDPERDTPERLGQYVSNFHQAITGLTGTPKDLQTMFDKYGIYAAKVPLVDSDTEYVMEHTARIFLVDQNGHLRLSYVFGTPDEDILKDIQYLLR